MGKYAASLHADTTRELFARDIHPRLFFGPEDLPALREKAASGMPGRALREMLRRCAGYLDPASPTFVNTRGGRAALLANWSNGLGSDAGDALHCLAFAHALTGEARWAEGGVAIIRAMVEEEGRPGDPVHATMEGQLPIAYDLLHGAMDTPMRQAVKAYLRKWGVEAYRHERLSRLAGHIWGLGTNMFLHAFEKYLLALAAAFDAETDWPLLEEAAGLARRSLHQGMDDGGAIYEGPSYGWGDAEWISVAAEMLRRAGVADLWAEEPRFANLCRHWAYLVLPGRRGQNTIGDAWRFASGRRPHWAALLHARRLGDPVLQWVWEALGGRGEITGRGEAPESFGGQLGYTVLWEDDAARARNPGEAEWPAARNSGDFGTVVMRSGWGNDDLYFSLLAAGRTPGCPIHQHVDAGHFCLFALNEAFSIDSGYGDIAGRYHSLVMPGGREPATAPTDFDQMYAGGQVAAFAAGRHAAYARVDIKAQWDCRWAFRHALLVNAPGAEPYVVLLDDFNYRSNMLYYDWLLNSEPGNRVEVDAGAERAVIHGRAHRLEVAWAYPAAGEYPVPHRLEVAHDEIDSFPLSHRTADVNYFLAEAGQARPRGGGRWGAGVRPRVKATLWGYTGHLLTALLPRRNGEAPVAVERLTALGHFGMIIRQGDVTDTIIASPIDRRLDLGGMRGEAQLALARRDAAGNLLWWAAADAYALAIDGEEVMARQGDAATLVEG